MDNHHASIRWPAEWELHKATWMAFPCRQEIWLNGLEKAQRAFADVANLISEYEPVKMLVDRQHLVSASKKLSGAIELIEAETDDSWTRDTAPVWAINKGQLTALDFKFNAWGEKFHPYDKDQQIAHLIAQYSSTPGVVIDMVLEGGSIHCNGSGVLLTTRECLLNKNRNPNMDQQEIESQLKNCLGIDRIIWLENGISGDYDTDGHVDNIACFVNENTILTQSCGSRSQRSSENFTIYQRNRNIIQSEQLNLVEIPEPTARYSRGKRVPLSYINFYIANDAIIIPKFGCSQDDFAFKTLQELFSDRKVHAVDANEILVGGGGIHCITMQQPEI